MTASSRPSLARATASVTGFVLAWTAISFAVSAVVFDSSNHAVDVLVGVALGLGSAWFELSYFPRRGLRLAPVPAVALRTAFYVGVTALVLVATFGWGARGNEAVGLLEVYASDDFARFMTQPGNAVVLGLVALASVVVNGARQVRLVLGQGTLSALVFGRYRVPVREERAFLFLDLTDSTGLAQRLGPADYHAFKNDFFADVAAPDSGDGRPDLPVRRRRGRGDVARAGRAAGAEPGRDVRAPRRGDPPAGRALPRRLRRGRRPTRRGSTWARW